MRARLAMLLVIGAAAAGGGAAFAATRHAAHPAKLHLLKGAAPKHVCHPGRRGSMLDSVQ